MVVAYTTDGKPLTEAAYNKMLEKGTKEIDEENYITHEAFKINIANWK